MRKIRNMPLLSYSQNMPNSVIFDTKKYAFFARSMNGFGKYAVFFRVRLESLTNPVGPLSIGKVDPPKLGKPDLGFLIRQWDLSLISPWLLLGRRKAQLWCLGEKKRSDPQPHPARSRSPDERAFRKMTITHREIDTTSPARLARPHAVEDLHLHAPVRPYRTIPCNDAFRK